MFKKSIKDYFNVVQLENHGPNHADDNPRKLKQTIKYTFLRDINKNFAGNLLLANRCL